MNKFVLLLVAISFAITSTSTANAKEKKEVSLAKVWFKNGNIYEGPMVKHWRTYAQSFTASGHNFHILPEEGGKSIKCKSQQVDSILILRSTHPEFKDSALFVSMVDGRVPLNGPKKKTNKMMRRVTKGQRVDFCTLPFMGNCMRGLKNDDQLLAYWLVRFHDTGEAFVFYSTPIWKGCNKNVEYFRYFCDFIKDSRPGLADAIENKFFPDKETHRQSKVDVGENALIFVDFIDNYLVEKSE